MRLTTVKRRITSGRSMLLWTGRSSPGILGPEAVGLQCHSPGERVTIATGAIADWMFVENEKLVGGFSLRAIRDRLSGEARKQFENSMWFKFD